MIKPYINSAIIGNSRILGCLTNTGELIRMFWPNIDYPQHIEKMHTGVFFVGQNHSTIWLSDSYLQHSQSYIKDTNIVRTVIINRERGLQVTQDDFVLPDRDVVVRRFEIENTLDYENELGFVVYSSAITTTPELRSVLFDFGNDALIHYKHGYYISVSGDREVFEFQLGNNARDSASFTHLKGYDSIGMMQDGALSWMLGKFSPGEKKTFNLYMCASDTLKGVKKMIKDMSQADVTKEFEYTQSYWTDFLKKARQIYTGQEEVDTLYKRSLLVFKLMSDEKSGGLMAAPEIDENFTKCGRYAYCWGRDAGFITSALDQSGLTEEVDKFYEWAVDAQDEDGSWQQRYHMDGNLAPSWGMQVDETGTLIWGMLKHYETTKNIDFLRSVWTSVQAGVDFLVHFIDEETGLPKPSYDLWEERVGEHTYSSAAVYAGIKAGTEIARILKVQDETIINWEKVADHIKEAMTQNLWKDDRKCFLRSVRTKLNPWGGEYSQHTTMITVNSKGYTRDVTLEDGTIDVSLLGVSIPFGVFEVDDQRVIDTVDTLERVLTCQQTGGIKRYEYDNYIGGNPWVLATLWVALYYIEKKDYGKAKAYFDWAVKCRTELDLLPEQVNRESGKPEWVVPLTWSHAMFVLVLIDLIDASAF